MIKKILLLLVLFHLASCHVSKSINDSNPNSNNTMSSSKKPSVNVPKTGSISPVVNEYILQYKDIAMGNMKKFGIPASIILAQGILESGAGKGSLAVSANNHFGIKCHKEWNGETVFQDDDAPQECFRKYKEPAESYNDHALFLKGRNRYASLFELPKDDYVAWAKGLRAAGYATDPGYPEKLISSIERYELYQYDNQVLGKKTNGFSSSQNSYEVQKGDTLYSISKRFNLDLESLKQKNNLIDNTIQVGQKLLLQ